MTSHDVSNTVASQPNDNVLLLRSDFGLAPKQQGNSPLSWPPSLLNHLAMHPSMLFTLKRALQQQHLAEASPELLFPVEVPCATFALLPQVESPWMQLQGKAAAAPMLWAPVMATILLQHSSDLPPSCFDDLLQAVHHQQLAEVSSQADLLWTLRYLHALAAAWPAALAANKQDHQKIHTSKTDRQWKVCSAT